MGKYGRLTLKQRKEIEVMRSKGAAVSQIADKIGVCRQTIYNELKRGNKSGVYNAEESQRRYENNMACSGRTATILKNEKLQEYIQNQIINERKSPKKISRELADVNSNELGTVCTGTIYSAIKRGYINGVSLEKERNSFATIQRDGTLYLPKWFIQKYDIKAGQKFRIDVTEQRITLSRLEENAQES